MKLLLKSLGIFVALIILTLIVLVFVFDPNMFKPRIEALAKEQGIALTINGDLGWTLWPSLGVDVNEIRVAAVSAPDKPVAQLQQASLMLAIKPLFSGNVIVHHVLIEGAVIDLSVDENGKGNWEALTEASNTVDATVDTPSQPDEVSTTGTNETLQLAVEEISVNNSSLNYTDAQTGQYISLQNIQLALQQFNLQGKAFAMQSSLLTRISNTTQPDQILELESSFNHQVQLAEDLTTAALREGQFKLVIKGEKTGEMQGKYAVAIDQLKDAMNFSGTLEVPSFNLKNLLAALGTDLITSENYALTDVSLTTNFAGSKNNIAFDPLTVKLDKTTLKGSLAVTDFATTAIKVVLNGDHINVDDYLAPAAENEATNTTAAAASGDEELIPLDTIKALNADISADFGQVTVMDMPFKNLRLRTTAKQGLITVNTAQATAYEGVIAATGSLDGRGNTAEIKFNGKVDRLQLEPFMNDMELNEKVNFTGAINATTSGSTRGVTMNQLMDALVNETNISGAQVRFFPLNIEQKFCQLVNLINKADDTQRDWDAFTEMEDLSGKITMAKRIITVESFNAGIEQLMLGTNGTINLASDAYDFRLPLKLIPTDATTVTSTDEGTTVAATSAEGCIIGSNYWLNRSLSLLRCHGSLADLNPVKDCRPDSKALASLTKDFAEYKLREKHGAKIDAAEQKVDAKKDELRKKLDEKLGGDGEGKKAEDLLKNLLKKKKDEQ